VSHDVYSLPEGLPALRLPTFEIEGHTLYKRITLLAQDARIVKVFYPVFPPDANAGDVLRWLQNR
jgi:peroxiredoxin